MEPSKIPAVPAAEQVRIAVAPPHRHLGERGTHHHTGQLTVGRDGQTLVLQTGDEVLPTDYVGGSSVTHCLADLVDREAVIYRPGAALSPSARYVVAPGQSVRTTNRGIVEEGCEVKPACFERGQLDIDDLVRRGAIQDRKPAAGPTAA